MKLIADLHIHSKYSRATSQRSALPELWLWAQLKGLGLLGTGDFTHPGWLGELKQGLEPAEPGLFRLKDELSRTQQPELPEICRGEVRFVLSAEISTIYKRGERTRKVHSVILAPDFAAAERLIARLERIGNLKSDGRPILGLDQRDLLQIVLDCGEGAFLVPAHIWTPWFSALGSKSGFDLLDDCYGALIDEIFAVETGLSSDPAMNWRLSALDRFTLISNSDCHSPDRLGREANLFDCDPSFAAIRAALRREPGPQHFLGTLEFFPEEGKYHLDGHRKCGVRLDPLATAELGGLCPQCGKPVTVGVLNRVEQLADRPRGERPATAAPFQCLIPLPAVIGQALGRGESTNAVQQAYRRALEQLGPELGILRDAPLPQIEALGVPLLAQAIDRIRRNEVRIAAGFDGEYGTLALFDEHERRELLRQSALFDLARVRPTQPAAKQPQAVQPAESPQRGAGRVMQPAPAPAPEADGPLAGLNPEQLQAALVERGPLLIVAGPGTGKTRTLTCRIARLVDSGSVAANNVLAVTFTNRAAREMAERLEALLGAETAARLTVCTFHALGLRLLREHGTAAARLLNRPNQIELLAELEPQATRRERNELAERIALSKARLEPPDPQADPRLAELYARYQVRLQQLDALDLDDLINLPIELLSANPALLERVRERWTCVSVDEYQDLNPAQQALLELIAPPGSDLCVIGDPDQAIYGFRGADARFIEQFEARYGQAQVLRLERNYRSSAAIVSASSQVIEIGRSRLSARLSSAGATGPLLTVQACPTDKAEAEFVAHQIERLIQGTGFFSIDSGRLEQATEPEQDFGFSDIAVLFRLAAAARPVEQALARLGVPYQLAGEQSFYERPEAVELLKLLERLCEQPKMARCEAGEAVARLAADKTDQPWAELRSRALAEGPLGLREFLDRVALRTAADEHDPRAQAVALLSMHAAKGLEFPVVFVIGCEEGLLPYLKQGDDASQLAEERRLLYVAMTRARSRLYLTHARSRLLFGRRLPGARSRFIDDIEAALTRSEQRRGRRKSDREDPQLDLL